MNKIINSKCICGKSLSSKYNDFAVLLPCEHIIHPKCIRYIINSQCRICKQKIINILTLAQIIKKIKTKWDPKMYQIYIDMMTYFSDHNDSKISYFYLILRQYQILSIPGCILGSRSKKDVDLLKASFLNTCNIHINIKNKNKWSQKRKVIISNHTTYLDPIIIYHSFNCGFLSSSIILDTWYTKNISKYIPLVIVNRGKVQNTVDKIKEHLDKKGDVCLFPEGIITHKKILARFRTGAFNTGYPIQPIILKYSLTIYDEDYTKFILKALSQPRIDVEIIILDLEYPPFSEQKINSIRKKMGKSGNLLLSRVSNRDVID